MYTFIINLMSNMLKAKSNSNASFLVMLSFFNYMNTFHLKMRKSDKKKKKRGDLIKSIINSVSRLTFQITKKL